ncbi:glucose 1-dehydrogenase [Streptomyces sp. SL13]|uniref:Glucose 1-dehydrogenase n=1 Tax=Streptantibioticus silvisoli TaxID=2705255 RepID=A0AA90JYD1_9ACTN|nr:glucose 1-dehydrogenase [Streptantibioticus silvisoli]MDI5971111.1 glucose 1-dehydrogenase [Streptantibioticus silvisoli]
MAQLSGKVALVTGGTTGIGLAVARRFAEEGAAAVYITGRRKPELDAAVEAVGERAIGVRGDVSDLADLDRLFATVEERSGRLDVVVANAGTGEFARLGEITEAHFDQTFDINAKGLVFTVQKALPLVPDGGSVILLSSSAALRAAPGLSMYAGTKAAIRSFARTWAAELADRSIRVNAITPGPVTSPGGDGLRATMTGGTTQPQGPAIPLGRVGRPEEVAATALYLASDQSSFTTGAELFVDGGITQV